MYVGRKSNKYEKNIYILYIKIYRPAIDFQYGYMDMLYFTDAISYTYPTCSYKLPYTYSL